MSGQVWYDQIGLNPDDRAKIYADKNRPLTLEEQKQNIEAEREKRKFDEDGKQLYKFFNERKK